MGLALGGVGGGDAVDDGLGLLVADLLVVVDDVAQVVPAAVVRLAHAHRVVRQVHVAVVAEDCWKSDMLALCSRGLKTDGGGKGKWTTFVSRKEAALTFRHFGDVVGLRNEWNRKWGRR